jgi:hypothetical protein
MKKKVCLLLISLLLPTVAQGENYAAASQLKSLFTTPSQRQQLDKLRDAGKYAGIEAEQVTARPVFREPLLVEMRGVLIKNGQQPVVWVNRGNTLDSAIIEEGIRVPPGRTDAASKQVPVRIYGKTYQMKPGEIWNEINEKVIDSYQIK